jgi:hypothetical protein
MELIEMIAQACQIPIVPLLAFMGTYIVLFLKGKALNNDKLTNNELANQALTTLENLVTHCVIATNQTYVEKMKKNGSFDETAQRLAFDTTYNAVMSNLTEDTKKQLATITTDLNKFVTELIESKVNQAQK